MNEKNGHNGTRLDRRSRKIDTTDIWIIPYADFMSVLMVLFLMMFAFAYTSKNEKRYGEIIVALQTEMGGKVKKDFLEKIDETARTEQTVMKFDEMVEAQNLKKYVTVSYDADQIKIMMKNPVLFGSGQIELRRESRVILHEVAQILSNIDNDIIVEGHTDDIPLAGTGKIRSNWELSQRRAIEVINYLIEKEKLAPNRFAAVGYGEYRPLYPNDTPDHRSQNRRIEINILRGKSDKQPSK
ncbi:MAG: flagellar motor protein MotB [Endomicrobiales bacterium]|nr:flagellar motor protein MotB [Endomicrobiales bacterium]